MTDQPDRCDQTVDTPEIGNTKNLRARYWIFTFNNYTSEEFEKLKTWSNENCREYVVQEETGEEGTPHLQGFWRFNNGRYFSSLKKAWPKMHLEKCNNIEACRDYCKKEETRTGELAIMNKDEPPPIKDPLEGIELYPWQKRLIEELKEAPHDRLIHWIVDFEGNSGKTSLAKHLCIQFPSSMIYLSGNASNCKYGLTTFLYKKEKGKMKRNSNDLKVVIFGITRSQENYVSYQALEEIKDGIFFNTKYESLMVVYNIPHVIVLANFEPEYEKLSKDRWKITKLDVTDKIDLTDLV